ncbi:MAG: NAD-dependent epimerase/dehydratase family protein [Acidimicrobiales bacterium]
MRVVVTGGSGFVGRHVVRSLMARGDEVVVADKNPYPDPEVACVEGDLREEKVVDEAVAEGTDAVVHLAAITSVLMSAKDPHAVFETNVGATELILERCRMIGTDRLVFASTNAVAGVVSGSIDEMVLPRPLTPYGASKAAAEMLFSAYAASYAMKIVSLRFTNIYGEGMQSKDSVVARIMRCALSGSAISVYGDGEQKRDYVYVTDAVRAIELALGLPGADTLTIGAGMSVSMNELWKTACEVTGIEIPRQAVPAKPGEMPAVVVDTKKARRLGFAPEVELRAGLAKTWADFQEHAP